MLWLPVATFVAVLLSGAAVPVERVAGAPLLVSAAVSLTEALSECGSAFERSAGRRISFNFGASNVLARQILHGAPVDVFVSADAAQMDLVDRAGVLRSGSRQTVVSNTLVIIATGHDGPRWADPRRLASPVVRRIAMGDPKAVPAGVYARQWLERAGLWRDVQGRIVPAGSARGALAAVAGGAVGAGIVYRTDARVSRGVHVVFEVAGEAAPAILYPAAVVRQARDPEGAQLFVEFLLGSEAQRIFAAHGFLPPPPR
jgi:molybdate transport system substrate-binding protein